MGLDDKTKKEFSGATFYRVGEQYECDVGKYARKTAEIKIHVSQNEGEPDSIYASISLDHDQSHFNLGRDAPKVIEQLVRYFIACDRLERT